MKDLVRQLRARYVFTGHTQIRVGTAGGPWYEEPLTEPDQLCWDAADEIERMRAALQSIADNTCCEGCQEAARVAKSALGENGNRTATSEQASEQPGYPIDESI